MLFTEKLKCIVEFYILLLSVKLIYLFIIKFIYLIYCKSRKINDILHSISLKLFRKKYLCSRADRHS
jgi:hypothetical protein